MIGKKHVQLLLFVYRTTKHSTTKLSPYEILFGQNPAPLPFPVPPINTIHDPGDYSSQLQRKLFELRELVEANIVEATSRQTEVLQELGTSKAECRTTGAP